MCLFCISFCVLCLAPQKKAVATGGGAVGNDTEDLQARLDQLRRGDDD